MRRFSHLPDVIHDPIRVLLVAPVHMVGGQAHAAQDIARGFSGDEQIRVSLQAIDPRLAGRLAVLTEAKIIRSIVRPTIYVWQLFRAARRADLLHVLAAAHTAFLFGAFPAVVIGRLLGRPVVLNYHDGRAALHFRRWGRFVTAVLRRTQRIVVPSAYLQREFARHGFPADVIPNVVDTAAFRFKAPRPLRHRLVSSRLLEPLYAVENTLHAFQRLKADYPDLVLDIYGGGAAAQGLRELAGRLQLEGVTFHGEITHSRMPEVLGEGGIMVNSSRVDNMPHFVLEAYAAGLPIVSTRAGGIPDMIVAGKTGLLVPIDDPAALASSVRMLLEDPDLALRLAFEGQQESLRYSWPRAREAWSRIYRLMTSSPARLSGA